MTDLILPGAKVLLGDCIARMKEMPDQSVQMCVTSPPYFGLRDYGHEGQLGLEETPEQYIANMVAVFREVRRVLADDGTLWVNIGDSYSRNPSKGGSGPGGKNGAYSDTYTKASKVRQGTNYLVNGRCRAETSTDNGIKHKDLIGIPWMLAFALRAGFSACTCCSIERRTDLWPVHNGHRVCIDCLMAWRHDSKIVQTEPGWYLRQDIIWAKPNPMPESVTDRCTKAHEYVFLLSKLPRYFYDAEAVKEAALCDRMRGPALHADLKSTNGNGGLSRREPQASRNRRSVWTIATRSYKGAHFAVYPPALAEQCILAGTSAKGHCPDCGARWGRIVERSTSFEGGSGRAGKTAEEVNGSGKWAGKQYGTNLKLGPVLSSVTTGWEPACDCGCEPVPDVVLDPFNGSGTTGAVAIQHGRQYIGTELNPDYLPLTRERLESAIREREEAAALEAEASAQADLFAA